MEINSLNVTFDEFKVNDIVPLGISKEEFRSEIMLVQDAMLAAEDMHTESPLNHYFAPGMYAREIHMKAGDRIIGKIHKHAHINIISKGVVDVITEDGSARYKAPYTFISEPETKRFVSIVTDTIWTTIHATDSKDLDEIEDEIIMKSYDSLIENGGVS